ncbi:hypothetical protein DMB38_23730 [Streptomyces sp. WAC 06738]|uniref:hypothetical protein n=1 Tax=Streptomyces sp. WAC 06738 TaxID=2203210 RepID=UPI000F6F02D3|nr:hypothetical protein [Streptomyces sp. WAC 06738]AZM48395.1 hypothetical protein DMB38_23730 [Streptomyces sp. WAC 06738]
MKARAMVSVVVAGCVALVATACGPDKNKDDSDAKAPAASEPSASTQVEKPSADPSPSAPSEKPSALPAGDGPAPKTKEGAIERYEVYLHAVGREDVDTVCEVAGPAAEKGEAEGVGPCTTAFLAMFQMISPEQKEALKTATVDPQGVTVLAPDKVEIPAEAVRASVTFSDSELGRRTMGYLKDEWFITD